MKKFSDLVDIPKLQELLYSLYDVTGLSSSIVDNDLTVLAKTGWTDICLNFHRVHPQTERNCQESVGRIFELSDKQQFIVYKCLNGLCNCVCPIFVEGEHIASLLLAQFLLEPPDEVLFRNQAVTFGFDEEVYLKALQWVPIIEQERLEKIIKLYINLAAVLAELGLRRTEQLKVFEEMKTKQADIKEQFHFLQTMIDAIPVPVFYKDNQGVYRRCNKAFVDFLGLTYDEIIGRTVFNSWLTLDMATKFHNRDKELHEHPGTQNYESSITLLDGRARDIIFNKATILNTTDAIIGIVGVMTDVTERRRVEKEMTRLNQLSVVGEMAASISHEIRNPLTTIRGYLQLLEGKAEFIGFKEQFKMMIEELDRANLIITEFLSLARNKVVDKELKNLNTVLRAMEPLLRADGLKNNKDVALETGQIPDLYFDEGEIRQLLLNLACNGLEAMSSGGILSIRTYSEDGAVVLAVRDKGAGIPAEIIDKVGTPFFTTKNSGTGLGLAMCYSIAEHHDAKLIIDTGPAGTEISVIFPLNLA